MVDFEEGELGITFADGTEATFVPLQFHFHAPSEHTVNGRYYDLEMHIVHKYKDSGKLGAVIGIFFDRLAGGNRVNPFIDEIAPETVLERAPRMKKMPKELEYTTPAGLNLASFLGSIDWSTYYSYNGSLTTPR